MYFYRHHWALPPLVPAALGGGRTCLHQKLLRRFRLTARLAFVHMQVSYRGCVQTCSGGWWCKTVAASLWYKGGSGGEKRWEWDRLYRHKPKGDPISAYRYSIVYCTKSKRRCRKTGKSNPQEAGRTSHSTVLEAVSLSAPHM
jgi:hypothetical protein